MMLHLKIKVKDFSLFSGGLFTPILYADCELVMTTFRCVFTICLAGLEANNVLVHVLSWSGHNYVGEQRLVIITYKHIWSIFINITLEKLLKG